jgi:DNA polymerase-3 subunit epsilon
MPQETETTGMRQIVFDTETTGLNERGGDRIVEIGCVELQGRRVTGNTFHHYLNPDRESDAKALEKHGLTRAFLSDKPRFPDIAEAFLDFVRGAELIAHNADFDLRFIDKELELCGKSHGRLSDHVSGIVDTLSMARKEYPGAPATLDALCKRFEIDLAARTHHGALLDSRLLADVYLAMTTQQCTLDFGMGGAPTDSDFPRSQTQTHLAAFAIPVVRANEEEQRLHEERLASIERIAGRCLW